jgi:GTPase SAR1 family protein
MERFQSLTPIYVQAAQLCFLVYSLDDIQSFRALKFWYNQLRKVNEKCPVVLVGNKADLGEQKRQVGQTEAKDFAREIEAAGLFETSCLDVESIQTLFAESGEIAANFVETSNGASSSEF